MVCIWIFYTVSLSLVFVFKDKLSHIDKNIYSLAEKKQEINLLENFVHENDDKFKKLEIEIERYFSRFKTYLTNLKKVFDREK